MAWLPPAVVNPDEELACMLVWYPAQIEYRRALLGAIAELSNVWNWEADRPTQADIRSAWLRAEDETLRCLEMACFDELIAKMEAVEQAIRDTACCGPNEPTQSGDGPIVYPVEGPTTELPSGGDFSVDPYPVTPATDPNDTGVVTEADWKKYACGAADYLVDTLIDWLRYTDFVVSLGYGAIQAVDWLVKRIAANVLPGIFDDFAVWTLPTYTELFSSVFDNLTTQLIQEAIDDLEAIRQDIRCAFQTANTADLAVSVTVALLNAHIQNAVVLALLTTGPLSAIASLIWNGAFDAQWDDGCACTGGEVVTYRGMRLRVNSASGTGSFGGYKVRARDISGNWLSGDWTLFIINGEIDEPIVMQRAPQPALDAWPAEVEDSTGLNHGSITDLRTMLTPFDANSAVAYDIEIIAVWDGSAWRPVIALDNFVDGGANVTVNNNRIIYHEQETIASVLFEPVVL
jgi:hypothetical protein